MNKGMCKALNDLYRKQETSKQILCKGYLKPGIERGTIGTVKIDGEADRHGIAL